MPPKNSKTAKAKPVEAHGYEFGGPLGAFAISFGLPIACYAATLFCNDISGCPVPSLLSPSKLTIEALKQDVGWPADGIWGLASWDVSAKVLGYYLLSAILHRVLPGDEIEGTMLASGGKLKYKFNTWWSTMTTFAICAAGTAAQGADFPVWTFIYDNYLQILTINIIIAYVLATFVYVRSFSVKPGNPENRELAAGGHSAPNELFSAAISLRFSDGRNSDFVICSTHSNPRILKSNRRSQYGQQLSTYDDEIVEKSTFSVDEYAEIELNADFDLNPETLSSHSEMETKFRQGIRRSPRKEREGSLKSIKIKSGDVYHATQQWQQMDSIDIDGRGKLKASHFTKDSLRQMSEELDFDEKWLPLIEYLSTFGLKESHFIQIYERHMPCLQINVASAQERLEFLLSLGVKPRDIRKIILRQPQILEYTVENNLKSHIAFLVSLGVSDSRIGQIITAAPSLFSYSVENSLKPTVRYLIEEVGIRENDVGKVVQLSPQILVQRIDNSWTSRLSFLSKELGAPRESIVKMVTKHPQILHYSIEDGILPRINFLRSIGMRNFEILKVLTGLTQVLSLSLENNLKPKYLYLVNELRNEVKSLTKYPTYFSLSLDQRIRPRHRFLVSLKKAPKGPFPLSSFVPTDECFCQQWAGTSLEKYLAFRQTLLLTELAKKYGKTGIPC